MSLYTHLTLKDRELIVRGVENNLSISKMAEIVGCHKNTISCEIKRNGGRNWYSMVAADQRYHNCRKLSRRRRLLENEQLRQFIVYAIVNWHWSPEQIAKRLDHENNS